VNGRSSQPDDWSDENLERLKDLHIIYEIKKMLKLIRELDEAANALKGGTPSQSDTTNTRLMVMRNLEEMKQRLPEKTYEIVEMNVLFALALREKGITPENIPQWALEFARSHPLKAKYTNADLEKATKDATEIGRQVQKVVDDQELDRKLAEAHSFKAKLDVVKEFIDANLVYGGKQLDEMGFTDFLIWRAMGSPKDHVPRMNGPQVTSTLAQTTQPSNQVTSTDDEDAPMLVTFDEPSGKVQRSSTIMVPLTITHYAKPLKVDIRSRLLGGSGIKYRLYPAEPSAEGFSPRCLLQLDVPNFAPTGGHELKLVVNDAEGKIGEASYFLNITYPIKKMGDKNAPTFG
jgi:hypothetical protein